MKFLTIDPGEHTGWSTWQDRELITAGTLELDEFVGTVATWLDIGNTASRWDDPQLAEALKGVEVVVCEDWALYPWKLQSLSWDKCRTARAIGALELICELSSIPFVLQPAAIKDAAIAGGAEDLFSRPLHENRHQNDAIMHGVFFTAANEAYGELGGV